MEVRILASAGNSGAVFDLRCEVREKLIDVLQREHPEALPRQRSELAITQSQTGSSMTATPGSRRPRTAEQSGMGDCLVPPWPEPLG
jgi:hypothetical protein